MEIFKLNESTFIESYIKIMFSEYRVKKAQIV